MTIFLDLVGKKYGRLLVKEKIGSIEYKPKRKRIYWLCQCDCGNEVEKHSTDLRSSKVKSCGCLQMETMIANGKMGSKHNMVKSLEYKSWQGMKDRCLNKHCKDYRNYGARGIKVCKEWRQSFESFYADMGDRPTPTHSLDRINNDGNYEPKNCRWSTPSQQMRNRTVSLPENVTRVIEIIMNHERIGYGLAYKRFYIAAEAFNKRKKKENERSKNKTTSANRRA